MIKSFQKSNKISKSFEEFGNSYALVLTEVPTVSQTGLWRYDSAKNTNLSRCPLRGRDPVGFQCHQGGEIFEV